MIRWLKCLAVLVAGWLVVLCLPSPSAQPKRNSTQLLQPHQKTFVTTASAARTEPPPRSISGLQRFPSRTRPVLRPVVYPIWGQPKRVTESFKAVSHQHVGHRHGGQLWQKPAVRRPLGTVRCRMILLISGMT